MTRWNPPVWPPAIFTLRGSNERHHNGVCRDIPPHYTPPPAICVYVCISIPVYLCLVPPKLDVYWLKISIIWSVVWTYFLICTYICIIHLDDIKFETDFNLSFAISINIEGRIFLTIKLWIDDEIRRRSGAWFRK